MEAQEEEEQELFEPFLPAPGEEAEEIRRLIKEEPLDEEPIEEQVIQVKQEVPEEEGEVDEDAADAEAVPLQPPIDDLMLESIGTIVASLGQMREQNPDNFAVEFSSCAVQVFQGYSSPGCTSAQALSGLNNFCHKHVNDGEVSKQALLLLGKGLCKAAVCRNKQMTLNDGLTPNKYGLPELMAPKPRTKKPVRVAPAPPPPIVKEGVYRHHAAFFGFDPKTQYVLTEEEEMALITAAETADDINTTPIDVENLNYEYQNEVKQVKHNNQSRIRMRPMGFKTRGRNPEYKPFEFINTRPLNAPVKPYEMVYDIHGRPAVKSEMLGEDEFFDFQQTARIIGNRYERIAERGIYAERYIMNHIGVSTTRRRYECDQCDKICANQHKFASHVRHAHPKTKEEQAIIRQMKAERAAEAKEEKKRKAALMPALPPIQREKRERRPLLARRPSAAALVIDGPSTSTAVVSNKIYVCPMCKKEVGNQHLFASHMRYNHPKDGTNASMAGRRATVKRINTDDPENELPKKVTRTSEVHTIVAPKVATSKVVAVNVATPKIDTPESALQALSSVLSASVTPKSAVSRTKFLPDGSGAYKCRVCGRRFANLNACAGHTRHCIAANNAEPSPPKPTPPPKLVPQKAAPVPTPTRTRQPPVENLDEEDESEDEEEEEEAVEVAVVDGVKTYTCRVCKKIFANPNSVAGHTRHCLAAHGGEPSARALARRMAKGGVALPTHIIKTEPLPISPLALTPSTSKMAMNGSIDALKIKKPVDVADRPSTSTASAPLAVASSSIPFKAVKVESLDEPAKPIGRTTRNSAAAAMDLQELQHTVEIPAPVVPAVELVETHSGRRSTRSTVGVMDTATPAVAPANETIPPTLSSPHFSRALSTRSSRSSARLLSPSGSDATSPAPQQIVTSTMPPPSKRTRSSTGNFDREIKGELMDHDHQVPMERAIKQELIDESEEQSCSTSKRRMSKGERKAAKASARGFETLAARTCYYCQQQCSTMHSGDRHIRLKHPGHREQIYSCSECSTKFLTLGGLENHWTKSEYCPDGFVMIAGRSIFELDEEMQQKAIEEKKNGMNDLAEDDAALGDAVRIMSDIEDDDDMEQEEEKVIVKKEDKKNEKKAEKPVEKASEKKIEKKEESKDIKKTEKPIEKASEKKVDKKEELKEVKKSEKPVEKVPEKKIERKEESKEVKKIDKTMEKVPEKKTEKPVEKVSEKKEEAKEMKKVEKPVEKVSEKKIEKKEETKVEKGIEKPMEKALEKKVEKKEELKEVKKTEKPVEKKEEKKIDKPTVVEKKVEKAVEKVSEKKIEKPVEKVSEKRVEKPVEKVSEKKVEKKEESKELKKAEKPVEKASEKKVDKPIEKASEKKVEKKEEAKEAKKTEKPVEKASEKKVEKPTEKKKEEPKDALKTPKRSARTMEEESDQSDNRDKPAEKKKVEKKEEPKSLDRTSKRAPKTKEDSIEQSPPNRPGSSTGPPAIISIAATRSGANRTRNPALRFEPDPTSQRYSSAK